MKILLSLLVSAVALFGQSGPGFIPPYAAGGGTAQAQTITTTQAFPSLYPGLSVWWLPTAANTAAAPTLAVNGFTAKPITKTGTTALVANDLTTTAVAFAIYDGTQFQLQNPQSAIPTASASVLGLSKCDNSTITCASGIMTAVGGGGGGITGGLEQAVFGWGGYDAGGNFNVSEGLGTSVVIVPIGTILTGVTFSTLRYSISTAATSNCNGGSSPCGFQLAVVTQASPPVAICTWERAYTGNSTAGLNIATTGVHSFTTPTGTAVSGGKCTPPLGSAYGLAISSESSALLWNAIYPGNTNFVMAGAVYPERAGYITAAATGTGSTYALPATLPSHASWTQNTTAIGGPPYLIAEN